MSLRVLLADESASIRKVFQLGLQDFGAEVKSVHNGLDVITVAEQYEPHIIFADILLQKKNGYEVSEELRTHEKLRNTPIVLMWSSFMELDHKRYKTCGAHGELEKPFDVETMRNLIRGLVPLTQGQQIAEFLTFPQSIKQEFVEEMKRPPAASAQENPVATATPPPWEVESGQTDPGLSITEEIESNSIFNLQVEEAEFDNAAFDPQPIPIHPTEDKLDISIDETWEPKPLNNQAINPPQQPSSDEEDFEDFASFGIEEVKNLKLDDFLYKPETGMTPPPTPHVEPTLTKDKTNPLPGAVQASPSAIPPSATPAQRVGFSPAETEAIIRSEVREIIQASLKAQLPIILERIVREELQRVLEDELSLKINTSTINAE